MIDNASLTGPRTRSSTILKTPMSGLSQTRAWSQTPIWTKRQIRTTTKMALYGKKILNGMTT